MGKMCATNDVVEVRERRIRQPIGCQICGRPSLYSYYSVQCCEGCKQFFRRVMVHQKEYFCRQKIAGNCQLQNGDKCNGCRLDRCLLTGMQPLLVTLPDSGRSFGNFLAKLEVRKLQAKDRRQNAQLKIAATNYGEAIVSKLPECRLLDSLLFTLNKHKAIWTADPQLSSAYLNRFHSIQQLVQQPDNILARAHQFPPCQNVSWDKAAYIEEMDLFGFGVEHNIKASAIDRLLFVEMAKTLPFFHRLDAGDQMLLLKHTCGPATLLMNCYYSAQAAADTITRSNGLCFMAPFVEVDRFRKDSKLFTMGHVLLCQSVSIVKRMDLSPADFALLLGLLYCSSTASGLSAHGRDLLYAESVLHSRALLNLLQSSLGPVAGANKYSECVLLLGIFFQMEHNLQTMYTYLEFFLSDKNLRTDIPKPIEYLTP